MTSGTRGHWAETVGAAVEEAMRTSQIPGIVVAAVSDDRELGYLAAGSDAAGRPIGRDTLFPVASITKLATALAILRLVDARRIGLDDELAHHLPEAIAAQSGVTIRRLLCHTSGLPADVPPALAPYAPELSWPTLAAACLNTELEVAPDERVIYSNLGYGLLALVVERICRSEFKDALHEQVLDPLGIEAYLGDEPPRAPARLSGARGRHAGTELEPYNSRFWRSLSLPWSGLVTTIDGALALLRAFDGRPEGFLQPATLAEATRNQVGSLACRLFGKVPWMHCHWGLGPELRDHKQPHWAPSEASPASYGHAGQSGCVVWAEPRSRITWVFAGARIADSGWLLRRGPAIGAACLGLAPDGSE